MRPPRVLFADDERDMRDLAVRHWTPAGLECIAASDGAQALSLAVERSPDLIVLDVHMPGLNGFSVLTELRKEQRTEKIPVIFITGDSDKAEVLASACANMNVAAFVRKPIEWRELEALIRRTLAAASASKPDKDVIVRGPLRIDVKLRRVSARGTERGLGPKRFDLLLFLARNKDGVPTTVLYGTFWRSHKKGVTIVHQTVSRLRADLRHFCGQEMIVNIAGGYKLL